MTAARARAPGDSASEFLPERRSLPAMRDAVQRCRGCALWKNATQAVFGAGGAHSRLVLVGEQPGNDEDLRGAPFVGPAGRVLDEALERAGIDRKAAYVTNAVKHFKWVPKGSRRLHQKPNTREVAACIPWLEAEIELLKPEVLVLLGATAAQAVFGSAFRVSQERGKVRQSRLVAATL